MVQGTSDSPQPGRKRWGTGAPAASGEGPPPGAESLTWGSAPAPEECWADRNLGHPLGAQRAALVREKLRQLVSEG